MKLEINSERLIREIQHDFNNAFPFLKIEFFANGNGSKHSSAAKKRIASGMKINETGRNTNFGSVELSDTMTVTELEKIFKEQFGLTIQVFRKSGNIWLETTMTDNWTLKQQNEHGKEISAVPVRQSNISDMERAEGD
ncbi:MAG: hypothetical protein ACXWV5_02340 [Flavitalea sp.]